MKKFIYLMILIGLLAGIIIWWFFGSKDSSRLTTYTLSDKLVIESFDPQTREGVRITIPGNFEIDSVAGRGKWWLSKIRKAGDKRWLTDSIAWHFGLGQIYPREDIGFWRFNKKIIWKDIDITKTGLADKTQTVDGEDVWVLNSRWFKNEFFVDSRIANEKLSVAVVNTTSTNGLGAKVAEIIEMVGMRTTMLETTNSDLTESCILTTSSANHKKLGVLYLIKVFECSQKTDESLKDDIRLELGKKLVLRLFG